MNHDDLYMLWTGAVALLIGLTIAITTAALAIGVESAFLKLGCLLVA